MMTRKKLYKEIYNDLIQEGYTPQGSKEVCQGHEVADRLESDADFINEIIKQEYGR